MFCQRLIPRLQNRMTTHYTSVSYKVVFLHVRLNSLSTQRIVFPFVPDKVKSFRSALQEEEQASRQINPKRPRAL